MKHEHPTYEELHNRVDMVRVATGVSPLVFRELAGLTLKDFDRIIKGTSQYEVHHIVNLCDELDLNPNRFFSGDIDYQALARHFKNDYSRLPDRYNVEHEKRSKMRSVHTIFEALCNARGSRYAKRAFSRFQVSPLHLADVNEFVSLRLITDVLEDLHKRGVQESEFFEIGRIGALINRNADVGKAFKRCITPHNLYRAMHEEFMHFFDKNWNYQMVNLDRYSCSVEITTTEETAEAFNEHTVGTREGCLVRQGIYSSLLSHLNGKFATVSESECAYVDSDKCVYHLSW